MDARVVKGFFDKQAGRSREAGEVFEASVERLNEINSAGFGELAKVVIDEVEPVAERIVTPESKKKKRSTR